MSDDRGPLPTSARASWKRSRAATTTRSALASRPTASCAESSRPACARPSVGRQSSSDSGSGRGHLGLRARRDRRGALRRSAAPALGGTGYRSRDRAQHLRADCVCRGRGWGDRAHAPRLLGPPASLRLRAGERQSPTTRSRTGSRRRSCRSAPRRTGHRRRRARRRQARCRAGRSRGSRRRRPRRSRTAAGAQPDGTTDPQLVPVGAVDDLDRARAHVEQVARLRDPRQPEHASPPSSPVRIAASAVRCSSLPRSSTWTTKLHGEPGSSSS